MARTEAELRARIEDPRSTPGLRMLAMGVVWALCRDRTALLRDLAARLVTDPRPPARSAALRALRRVATREATLDACARALAIETRRDVVVQLLESLGHGRHEPSLPALFERLHDNDSLVRQGAHAAIRAWGHDVTL